MIDQVRDLTSCDLEPIHRPGAIQPHGVLLAVEPGKLVIRQVAGKVDGWFGCSAQEILGMPLRLLDTDIAARTAAFAIAGTASDYLGTFRLGGEKAANVLAHRSGKLVLLEFEPAERADLSGLHGLGMIEDAARSFEQARGYSDLCHHAAHVFRQITGFDRVMVYRFLEDGAGMVVAEDRVPDLGSFLHHRFPASDIPKQARELYVRNLVRVIPDVHYTPAPLLAPSGGPLADALDMSDCVLRSVSPIHVQYLKNMEVAASASISIIEGGTLWGLISCHHRQPRTMPYEVRAICRVLSRMFSQQLVAQQDIEQHRQRIRLRALEDELLAGLVQADDLENGLASRGEDLLRLTGADGVAISWGSSLTLCGRCPRENEVRAVRDWLLDQELTRPYTTETLGQQFLPAGAFAALGSGLLAVVLDRLEPFVLLWFRAEEVEVLSWGGNPHKAVGTADDGRQLTPRASFELWQETVRGRARSWSLVEIETAARLRTKLVELRQGRQLGALNTQLHATVEEKEDLLSRQEALLGQKDILLREVNHRVQNSLQLVSGFLGLQIRETQDEAVLAQLEEARRRLMAVALVHRRLYQSEQIQSVEMGRYLEDLRHELVGSLGAEWSDHVQVRSDTISVPTDQAVSLGLITTELVINAAKYAYGGAAGPIDIQLKHAMGRMIALTVADRGSGTLISPQAGFGTKMIKALCAQWRGSIDHQDNQPGKRVIVTAMIG